MSDLIPIEAVHPPVLAVCPECGIERMVRRDHPGLEGTDAPCPACRSLPLVPNKSRSGWTAPAVGSLHPVQEDALTIAESIPRIDYESFLGSKIPVVPSSGIEVDPDDIHPSLHPFQRDLVRWSLRKGRSAIFATTGMGKTRMQLEWARLTGERVLMVAPLAVARQTVREAESIGIDLVYARHQSDAGPITITNYEMVDKFDADQFGAVVLDESSILKSQDGKTRTRLIEQFSRTPYRLCCTATPAPNDIAELANHAEFLGVLSRVEMLATFFLHDSSGDGWRLKGHAREPFYRWLASWGMSLQHPSDLGYANDGYDLPPLEIRPVIVRTDYVPTGQLFATTLKGVGDRAAVRKSTIDERVREAEQLMRTESDEPWIAWVGLNDEGRELAKLIPGAELVEGNQTPDEKADALLRFSSGESRVLITKPSIAGFGMNFQRCARMVFIGLSDSYEQYFQAIRRCWRYGQERPVHAYIVLTDAEEAIYQNVLRKEREAFAMATELVKHVANYERAEIGMARQTIERAGDADASAGVVGSRSMNVIDQYVTDRAALYNGDSAEVLQGLPDQSIDFSVFSPPFQSLFVYSPSERDLGNSATPETFWQHFGFISRELLRVMKPGRIVAVHVAQVSKTKATHGVIGLFDFRGDTIRHFDQAGFTYTGEVCIDKDPQAQAIRTKSKALLFTQFHKDSSWSRPALADYIVLFRAPGENAVPIEPDVTNDEWIQWARPIWYGIRESETLNVVEAREGDDERHICPLQLGTIERCIRLWSNPGETVLTPFAGIGSEVYQAVKLKRRGIGIELKPSYFKVAARNVRAAEQQAEELPLFAALSAD